MSYTSLFPTVLQLLNVYPTANLEDLEDILEEKLGRDLTQVEAVEAEAAYLYHWREEQGFQTVRHAG